MIQEHLTFALGKAWAALTFWNLIAATAALLYVFWWRRCHPRFHGRTFKRWSLEKYGPVMSIRIGREEAVVLNTYDAVHQALVKQSSSFSDRPWLELVRVIGNHGVIAARYDETFKVQKHFGLKFLREKGMAGKEMEAIVNDEADSFVDFIMQFKDKPVDMKKYLYWLTSNTITKIALGRRYDYGDPEFLDLLDTLNRLFNDPQDSTYLKFLILYPFMSRFPPFSAPMKRTDDRVNKILAYMQSTIDEHRQNFDPNNVNDFVDAFIYEQKFGKQNESFTDRQFCAYCYDLFVAGSETSSTTLAWCLVYLLNHPESYKIIEKEIEDCLGADGIPSMEHKEQMPYTCAFIQEVMRAKTLAPLSAPHMTSNTTELMGYVIPKGTKVFPNLEGVHLDPVDWPNPEVFNPKRHIDEDGKFVASKKIIPFSIGSRFCLGESLARVEIFIFCVKLIQKFRIRSSDSYLPPLDRELFSTVLCPRECEVIMEVKQ